MEREQPIFHNSINIDEISFYGDPRCPWTFNTARWLENAAQELGLKVSYFPLSLYYLNKDSTSMSDEIRNRLVSLLPALRLLAHKASECAVDAKSIFFAQADFIHGNKDGENKQSSEIDVDKMFLNTQFDSDFQAFKADPTLGLNELQAFHKQGLSYVGSDVGSPVISFNNGKFAIHGPILSEVPQDNNGEMLEAVAFLSSIQAFSEIKRARLMPLKLN